MTLNAKTGEIVAMTGGYDFLNNKFNNAVQAYRQTGSAFKPFGRDMVSPLLTH